MCVPKRRELAFQITVGGVIRAEQSEQEAIIGNLFLAGFFTCKKNIVLSKCIHQLGRVCNHFLDSVWTARQSSSAILQINNYKGSLTLIDNQVL